MKDNEIKEILENVRKCCEIMADQSFVVYQKQDILQVLDYITNLQEENERLKEQKEHLLIDLEGESEYKIMCEKAIEYIKHSQNYGTMAQVMPHLKPYVNGDDLLNILQGDNKE